MLKDIIGSFVQLEDIPSNAGIRNLKYGMNPLYVIDDLYRVNINNLYGGIQFLEPAAPSQTMNEALANFSMFNIVDDVEKAVQKSVDIKRCVAAAKADCCIKRIEDNIDRMSEIYFDLNECQMDCFSVIEGVKGELLLFASRLPIKIDLKRLSDFQCAPGSPYLLSSPEVLIAPKSTEANQLRKIKQRFKMLNWLIMTIISAICDLYKQVAPPIEKPEEPEIDL